MRYIPELEMESNLRAAAIKQGFDAVQADMLAACGRNIYAMGCEYPPNTVTMLQEICRAAAADESWPVLLGKCIAGEMPRLRSAETATVRLQAAKAAADRKRRARAQQE